MDEQGEYRKYRNQTGVGKGDKRRPTHEEIYRKNFDEIDWRRNKPAPKKQGFLESLNAPAESDAFRHATGR